MVPGPQHCDSEQQGGSITGRAGHRQELEAAAVERGALGSLISSKPPCGRAGAGCGGYIPRSQSK